MDEILTSMGLVGNSEKLRFGDDGQKMEKMNQSFLIIKKKMCVTKDLLEKYSDQIQKNNELVEKFKRKCGEFERIKSERDSMNEEIERLKQQSLTNRAKALKFDMERSEYEQTKRKLQRELDEKNTKIASDQQHIQQLICKLGDEEDRFSEKIMEKELEISSFQSRIKELESGLGSKKKRGKHNPSPVKTVKKLSLGAIDDDETGNVIPIIKEDIQVLEIKKHFVEIGVNTDEMEKPIVPAPQIIMTINPELPKIQKKPMRDSSMNTDVILPPPKPASFNKSIMTNEFYDTRKNAYPLFCDECEKPFTSLPVDKIFKVMTTVPPLIHPVPPSPIKRPTNQEVPKYIEPPKTHIEPVQVQNNNPSNSVDSSVTREIQKKLKSLERRVKKREKLYKSTMPQCGHGQPINCCGHNRPVHETPQIDMMAEFWARMMSFNNQGMYRNRERPSINRKKKIKKVKKKRKISVASVKSASTNDWDIEVEPLHNDNINIHEERMHYSSPIVRPQTRTISQNEKNVFEATNSTQSSFHDNFHRSKETVVVPSVSRDFGENNPKFNQNSRIDDLNFSNIDHEPENHPSPEETRISRPRRTTRSSVSEYLEPEVESSSRKRKRSVMDEPAKPPPKARSNLLKNLRNLKKNHTAVVPVKSVQNKETVVISGENNKSVQDQPAAKKRIAHIPKPADEEKIPTNNKDIEKTQEKEELKTVKKVPEKNKIDVAPGIVTEKRVTRSLFRSSEISASLNPAICTRTRTITQMKPPPRKTRKNSVSQNQKNTNQLSKLENLFGDPVSPEIEESGNSVTPAEDKNNSRVSGDEGNTNRASDLDYLIEEKIIPSEIMEAENSADLAADKEGPENSKNDQSVQDISYDSLKIKTDVPQSPQKSPTDESSSCSGLLVNNVEEKIEIEAVKLKTVNPSLEIKIEKLIEDNVSKAEDNFDESPASPDPEGLEEIAPISPMTSIYETAMIVEDVKPSTQSEETTTPVSIPQTPETCVKELRNRSVSVSPNKSQISLTIKEEKSVASVVEKLPERINIEFFLNRHMKDSKNKQTNAKTKLCRKIATGICKKSEEMVKEELKRLIDSEEWSDDINQSVSKNLVSTNSSRLIAKSIVDMLLTLSEASDSLDKTYTPPAPLMTKNEQRIVALLATIETEIPDIISWVFKSIEESLFRLNNAPEFEGVECLARIFTVLARMKKDREKVRIMICDALYCLQKKALVALFAVLTSWPEVLPEYDADNVQLLPLCIAHVISSDPSSQHAFQQKINQVKRLAKVYYHYPNKSDDPMSKGLIAKLMDALIKNPDRSVETAIILLAKKEGTAWTFKNIINILIGIIIDQNHPSVYNALKVLGFLLRTFPVKDEDGNIRKIIDQLRKLIDSGSTPPKFQEGVISALLSLSRFQFNEIAMTILNWHPPGILSPLVYEQLEIFFKSRNTPIWNGIKQQSHIYYNKTILPLQQNEKEKKHPTSLQ